jgi:hypothetical protein
VATDPGSSPGPTFLSPGNPATINGQTDMTSPATPAMMALPANPAPLAGDANSSRKWYTISASLREIYDDNVTTSSNNPQSSLETELSPSILADFPSLDNDFSARYTMDITYYSTGPDTGSNGGNGGSETLLTHEFVAQYTHAFSDRFNLNLAEEFRYYTEPSIDQSTGTNYQNGAYIANILNGTLTSQWTPLFGTTTTYSNIIVRYDNSAVALVQNNIENTGSQTFSFAILPKIGVNFGGIVDDVNYNETSRGYTAYTGFIGIQWQALPSLSVSGRGGGTYVEIVQGQPYTSPYAALTVNWTLGKRSALTFDYSHEVTPTDQIGANGQIADRFNANFRYDITSSLSSHLQLVFTNADITQQLLISGAGNSYTESTYALDTGLTYHYNNYLDLDSGITLSGVSSGISTNDYTRDQVYVGVRGTY